MNRAFHRISPAAFAAMMVLGACSTDAPKPAPTAAAAVASTRSVTVYPVLLAGQPREDVAEVVGLMLERGGLQDIEIAPAAFTPDPTQSLDRQAADFGALVARGRLTTEYALFASYHGSPATGVAEVRGAMVDARGKVVWQDRQKPGDPTFDRVKPGEPMTCCVLLVERLREPLSLGDPNREDAPEGKMAERWRVKSGGPTKAEEHSVQEHREALRKAGPRATVRVFPARIGDEWSVACAERLTTLINDRGLLRATVVREPLRFEAPPSPNEQKILWSGARSLQTAVRAMKPGTDYVLVADFLLPPGGGEARGVHFYVLTPDGGWAIVDFQNSHHEDFEKISPSTPDACCDLVAVRLAAALR